MTRHRTPRDRPRPGTRLWKIAEKVPVESTEWRGIPSRDGRISSTELNNQVFYYLYTDAAANPAELIRTAPNSLSD